jgi:tetratricopeptide (TPR) repeat protein
MKRFWVVLALAICATAAAHGQTPSPLMQHFRAYQQAMASNDLVAAETEAAAALAASEARDGAGGRTSVLALNLAMVRLELGRRNDAIAPAQQALTSTGNGVDPIAAELILGRAELQQPDDRGLARIRRILELPSVADDGQRYEAAADAGRYLTEQGRFADARIMWTRAIELAPNDGFNGDYARAGAHIGLGVAAMMGSRVRGEVSNAPPTGTRFAREVEIESENTAWTSFSAAEDLMVGHVVQSGVGENVGLAEQRYADALAWRAGLAGRMRSQDIPLPELGLGALVRTDSFLPVCQFEIDAEPEPRFPRGLLNRLQVGAVVVRIGINERAAVTEARVLSAVGGQALTDAVEAVAPRWRIRRTGEEERCTIAVTVLKPVYFYIQVD